MKNREKMIEDNLGLAGMVAKKYARFEHEYDDLFQVGCIGLMKAVDLFEPDRGLKLSTLAVRIIHTEIFKHMRKQERHKGISSLDATLSHADDFNLLDVLESDCNTEMNVVENIQYVGYLDNLKIVSLEPQERESIKLRSKGLTQKEIAKLLGTNQVQVSRYLKRARNKIVEAIGWEEGFKKAVGCEPTAS